MIKYLLIYLDVFETSKTISFIVSLL